MGMTGEVYSPQFFWGALGPWLGLGWPFGGLGGLGGLCCGGPFGGLGGWGWRKAGSGLKDKSKGGSGNGKIPTADSGTSGQNP